MGILIRHNGQTQHVEPRNGSHFGLREMQEYLGPHIQVARVGDRWMALAESADQDGLTVNSRATMLARQHGVADVIFGDVLLLEPTEFS